MEIFKIVLLCLLVGCALAATLTKRLLAAVVVFMGYSLVMSIVWVLLESPDLAITEAAVGAGISGILMLVTLHKLNRTAKDDRPEEKEEKEEEDQ